ncbi:hypothetical protein HY386_02905 [Candidatus Daviesbacteria bacterium]|nr:hypothetical protein [Candidatus Daviesbacteria bacterium]
MARNTLFLVVFLAIVAALVVGVQIGRTTNPQLSPTPAPQTTAIPTPTPQANLPYTNTYCGFSFTYPNSLTLTPGASGSAVISDGSETILMACQTEIPRPPLISDRIEEASIAGVTDAKIYHDSSANDGTPIDALIFNNPANGFDIFISGLGPAFNQVISSIQLLP